MADSIERIAGEMDEAAEAYAGHHSSGTFRRLATRLRALSPAGGDWVMVPREPTKEMRAAGERERISRPTNMNPYHVWAAMLAASPQQEPGAVASGGENQSVVSRLRRILADSEAGRISGLGDTCEDALNSAIEHIEASEARARAFCRKHGLDPTSPVDVAGIGVTLPRWKAWEADADRDALDRACEAAYATTERLAKPAATERCDFCGARHGDLHAFDCTALDDPSGQTLAGAGGELRQALQNAIALWGHRCTDCTQLVWLESAEKALATSAGTTGDAEKWIPDEMDVDNTMLQVRYGIDYMMGWNECRDSFLLAARRAREVG